MRRTLVLTALSACLAACAQDGGDGKPDDAGSQVTVPEDAEVEREASAPSGAKDSGPGETPMDSGTSVKSDAGAGTDASLPPDAGQDAGGARDSGMSMSTDAGAVTGVGCAGKAYKLCEDFESANVGAIPSGWTAVTSWGGGTAVVGDDEFHSGAKSLKGANTANGQTRIGKSLSSLGATANKHWGRVFYKVKSPATLPPAVDPPNGTVFHNTIVGLKGATESRVVDTIVNGEGKNQFIYNLPDDSCCEGSQYSYTSYDGKWHCAEWFLDATAKQFRFYYEGAEVTTLRFDPNKAKLGAYTQVIVGWIGYQTSKMPYNQAWVDDLAIDDNRIGCN